MSHNEARVNAKFVLALRILSLFKRSVIRLPLGKTRYDGLAQDGDAGNVTAIPCSLDFGSKHDLR